MTLFGTQARSATSPTVSRKYIRHGRGLGTKDSMRNISLKSSSNHLLSFLRLRIYAVGFSQNQKTFCFCRTFIRNYVVFGAE